MAKYYFEKEDPDEYDRCYHKPHFIDKMEYEGVKEIQVYEAVLCRNSGFFYCSEIGEVGDSNDSDCGRSCESYIPRNGISGRCKFSKGTYYPGKAITLKLK